jgi:hypothetical protein
MVHIWQRSDQTTDTKVWTSINFLIQVTGSFTLTGVKPFSYSSNGQVSLTSIANN